MQGRLGGRRAGDEPAAPHVIWSFWGGRRIVSNAIKWMKDGAERAELQPILCTN